MIHPIIIRTRSFPDSRRRKSWRQRHANLELVLIAMALIACCLAFVWWFSQRI